MRRLRRPALQYRRRIVDALAFGLALRERLPRRKRGLVARAAGYMDSVSFSRACYQQFGHYATVLGGMDWRSIVEQARQQ